MQYVDVCDGDKVFGAYPYWSWKTMNGDSVKLLTVKVVEPVFVTTTD